VHASRTVEMVRTMTCLHAMMVITMMEMDATLNARLSLTSTALVDFLKAKTTVSLVR
jgi:hypothetical protein